MTLYSEDVNSKTMAEAYPVNALRNRALKQAQTEARPFPQPDCLSYQVSMPVRRKN